MPFVPLNPEENPGNRSGVHPQHDPQGTLSSESQSAYVAPDASAESVLHLIQVGCNMDVEETSG